MIFNHRTATEMFVYIFSFYLSTIWTWCQCELKVKLNFISSHFSDTCQGPAHRSNSLRREIQTVPSASTNSSRENVKLLPSQPRHLISPMCFGSVLGSPPGRACPKHISSDAEAAVMWMLTWSIYW